MSWSAKMRYGPTPTESGSRDLPSGSDHRIKIDGLRVMLRSDPPGLVEARGSRDTFISIHVGPSVQVRCSRQGYTHRGTAVHGDIEIIPANTPGAWEISKRDTALLIGISQELLSSTAGELGLDLQRVEIRNRFQVRDPQIENIGWALKAEMDSGCPSGRLYLDSLAVSVAARLLRGHSSAAAGIRERNGRISGLRMKRVLSHIEDNLAQELSLRDVASLAGLSVSHFKRLFRETAGLPLHRYVIHRRVERAKNLLIEGRLPISQIALETGFAHQSHLAHHVRRVLGVSPKEIRDEMG